MIWGLDPGPLESALVCLTDGEFPIYKAYEKNELIRNKLYSLTNNDTLYIEMVANMGMPAGQSLFETCVQIGRFIQVSGTPFNYIYRREVKLYLCGNPRANDATIRQAIIDLYGGVDGKSKAIGNKSSQGPLYGIKGDLWSALAIALTGKNKAKVECPGSPLEKPDIP